MHDERHATLGTLPGVAGVIESWVILALLVVMLGLALWAVGLLLIDPRQATGREPDGRTGAMPDDVG